MFRRLRYSLVAVAALGVLLAGCGGSTHDMDGMDLVTPSGTSGASADDAMFAQMMIPHHEQAVEMAELAESRAEDPEIQALAAQILAAQQPEIDTMTGWLTEWGVPVMPGDEAMDAHGGHGMSGMLSDDQLQELADSSGAEFDRLFAQYMIEHHEGAIDMAEDVQDSADPRVAALAAEIITAQQAEIEQMRAFLDRSRGSAASGGGEARVVGLSTALDHAHAAVPVTGALLVGTHTGVVRVDMSSGEVSPVGEARDDFMALTGSGDVLLASGHPGEGSSLPDPVGLLRSVDGAQTWQPVSLTGEIDFHSLAVADSEVAGIATTGELLYSADGGVAWDVIDSREAISLAWFDGDLWIADGAAMQTWSADTQSVVTASDSPAVLIAAAPDGSRLWALLRDGSVVSTTDGRTWATSESVIEAAAIAATSEGAVVVTPNRLYVVPVA